MTKWNQSMIDGGFLGMAWCRPTQDRHGSKATY